MKKSFIAPLALAFAALPLTACTKQPDYNSYVSEYRHDVYLYQDDGVSVKIYLSDKETPYNQDGIKGEMTKLCEIFYYADKTPKEVEVSVNGLGGEMNYQSTTRSFYLSFTYNEDFGAKANVALNVDGNECEIVATNVRTEGTIDGATALRCVREYDEKAFESLTDRRNFNGEISIRLLYDEGCYYYVGICNRQGETHAYLLSAADGKVIAERDIPT